MPNPSLPTLSPEALHTLRLVANRSTYGPDKTEFWTPDHVELIEGGHVVVAELARSVRLPGDDDPRTRAVVLTQVGRDYINQVYLEGEADKARQHGSDDYTRLQAELNRVVGNTEDLLVVVGSDYTLQVHRAGETATCLIPNPELTLAELRELDTAAGADAAWCAL